MPSIVFTVTNDLTYDRRMIRICTSLACNGYDVTLAGRRFRHSAGLVGQPFQQKRIRCIFTFGFLFYAEFNTRLFFYLLFKKFDAVCAIDLDTILPGLFASKLKNKKRVYDAHELFCEMKEIVTRPAVYKFWKSVERFSVPKFKAGYTVNEPIAEEFKKMYGCNYAVIRNMPAYRDVDSEKIIAEKYIVYRGAVNEGRSFETLIPAMLQVDATLIICGEGNFLQRAMKLTGKHGLQEKVIFKCMVKPSELDAITEAAVAGITLFDKQGLSNYFSLANRFFDYIQCRVPQLCVNYPVYRGINEQYHIAVMIDDISAAGIAEKLNRLLHDNNERNRLRKNCDAASKVLNWQMEEKQLLSFYNALFE